MFVFAPLMNCVAYNERCGLKLGMALRGRFEGDLSERRHLNICLSGGGHNANLRTVACPSL